MAAEMSRHDDALSYRQMMTFPVDHDIGAAIEDLQQGIERPDLFRGLYAGIARNQGDAPRDFADDLSCYKLIRLVVDYIDSIVNCGAVEIIQGTFVLSAK